MVLLDTQVLVGLGNMFPKANLLPGLVELATDDNVTVRAAAVQAAVSMLTILTTGIADNILFYFLINYILF